MRTPEARRVFNFCAGPAAIAESVLEEARADMLSYRGSGMSVMEISHRSALADDLFEEAEANLRRLLGVPKNYRVLFLQGGGSQQFSMVPMNFLRSDESAEYILTGHWGAKAIGQAGLEGTPHVAWSGEEERFVRVPENAELDLLERSAYTYFTSNETIQGVQFDAEPTGLSPLVCDASSDFLSRPVEIDRFGLLYACAQKNAGPSGLTVVIISDEMLDRTKPNLHRMFDYREHAAAGSRLNTPPMFSVYLFLLITRWIEQDMGGLSALAVHNQAKADTLYARLDRQSDFYTTHAKPTSRSIMNVTFRTPSAELDAEFLAAAKRRDLTHLAGHRSVGGMRASIYNAMPVAGVEALCELLDEFRDAHQ